VTAIDERKQRDGRPLEFLGTYDPTPAQEELKLNIEGIEAWMAKGAQMSDTVRTLVKRARRRAVAAAGAS
jgi:small subunit ribosomal protein S16